MPAGGFGHPRALFVWAELRMSCASKMPIASTMSTQMQVPELENSPSAIASLMASGDLPAPATQAPSTPPVLWDQPTASRVRRLSIVVPARNEGLNMAALRDEINAVLAPLELRFHDVLAGNDGSDDETAQLASDRGARVISHPVGLGNGAAVKRGIREAVGDWILLLDGDGQHPPHELPAMIEQAQRYDMVVASRGGKGGSIHRNIANQVYNRFASYVSGRKIPDLTSGFRLMRADVAKAPFLTFPASPGSLFINQHRRLLKLSSETSSICTACKCVNISFPPDNLSSVQGIDVTWHHVPNVSARKVGGV